MSRVTTHKGYDGLLEFPLQGIPDNCQGMVSPCVGKQNGLAPPIHTNDPAYEEQRSEFLEVRRQVECNHWPTEYLSTGNPSGLDGNAPILLRPWVSQMSPKTAANLVAMDRAPMLGVELYDQLILAGVPTRPSYRFIPFVEHQLLFYTDLTQNVLDCMTLAFEGKNFFGGDRPEEDFNEIPPEILTGTKSGCPPHKSYPAGHGANFGATYYTLINYFDFSNHIDVLMQLLDACWQAAHYRTLLGVHARQDNDAGFSIAAMHYQNAVHESPIGAIPATYKQAA